MKPGPGLACASTEKRKVSRLLCSETLAWKTLLDAGSLFSLCVFDSELLSAISVACLPVAAGPGNGSHEKGRKSAGDRHRTREREGVPSGCGTW